MKWYAKLYTRLVFIFLYLPIIVLIAFSFNESKSRASWTGFSFHWYKAVSYTHLSALWISSSARKCRSS